MKHLLYIALALCVSLSYAQNKTWEGLDLSDYPYIQDGFGEAETYSHQKKKLVIYISGGQGVNGKPEPYAAREYAELLYNAFKNPKYTNYPTEIVVFYDEKGKDRSTKAIVVICGEEYFSKKGTRFFSPVAIGNNIDIFTRRFYQNNCSSPRSTQQKGAGF